MTSLTKEFTLLAMGGFGGWLGTMIVGNPSSTTQVMGFLGGAALLRGVEYNLEQKAQQKTLTEKQRSTYSYAAGAGALSMGIAAALVSKSNLTK